MPSIASVNKKWLLNLQKWAAFLFFKNYNKNAIYKIANRQTDHLTLTKILHEVQIYHSASCLLHHKHNLHASFKCKMKFYAAALWVLRFSWKRAESSQINRFLFSCQHSLFRPFGSNHIPVDWNELKLSFDTLPCLVLHADATEKRYCLQTLFNTYFTLWTSTTDSFPYHCKFKLV